MRESFRTVLEDNPVIIAIKNEEELEKCLTKEPKVVFVLYGDICSITGIVARLKEAGKVAVVHMDLIIGISGKEAAVDYLKEQVGADGIITTKSNLIKRARQQGLYTVLRFFVMDSMSLLNIEKQVGQTSPDVIEILPGVMPKVIRQVTEKMKRSRVPVIAGGLIRDREDVMAALNAGAVSVSSTNETVWNL